MREIDLELGKASYKIKIEKGICHQMPSLLAKWGAGKKIVLITDEKVGKIYAQWLKELTNSGIEDIVLYEMPEGECHKTLETATQIYEMLAEENITRQDLLVAFGGGVVGDLVGFVAATYLRGIDFIQIPTTLLAQVDSSVGGKVGVDLPQGKNLVGQFYQPKEVWIDPTFLESLEDRVFYDGMAEVIKYACILDRELFKKLEALGDREALMGQMEEIIALCCQHKAKVVEVDEKDTGLRMILNFGHTLGHGIEKYYDYKTYSHGQAVAIGMVSVMACFASEMGIAVDVQKQIRQLLIQNHLPTAVAIEDMDRFLAIMKNDKKKAGNLVKLIGIADIGKSYIVPIDWQVFEEKIRQWGMSQ